MTAPLTADFNATASEYDAARRRLIPCFDDYYGAVIDFLPFGTGDEPRILDIGAGTGLLSALVRTALPRAHLHLIDIAEEMLALAKQRFARDSRVSLETMDISRHLPAGPFDAVVSALAIHHLDDSDKRALFQRLTTLLRPGGVFVNAEQILAPTPATQAADRARWTRAIRTAGATDADIAAAARRMAHDQCSPLADQMRWLEEAGFGDVDCVYKNGWFAVYGGRR